jgi:hypothetical protein
MDSKAPSTEGYDLGFLAAEQVLIPTSYPLDIRPELPVLRRLHDEMEQSQMATSRPFWKGFYCEKCGRLSCRLAEDVI